MGKSNKKTYKDKNSVKHQPKIILNPLNSKQERYIDSILNTPVTVCIGSAGTSKSYIPTTIACQMLVEKTIDRVVVCRPTEGPGKSTGFTPGTEQEKLEVWLRPITETMKMHLGASYFQLLLKRGKIEYCDLHKMKGRSYDNCFIIADEAEDMDVETIKSLVTRVGQNTTLVINGDIKQTHITKKSGLGFLLKLIEDHYLPVSLIEFTLDECVRSDVTKLFLQAFELEEEKLHKGRK